MLPLRNDIDLLPLVGSSAQETEENEVELILSALKDVKSKSGYGNIHILVYAGAVYEVESVVKQRTKKAISDRAEKTRPKP